MRKPKVKTVLDLIRPYRVIQAPLADWHAAQEIVNATRRKSLFMRAMGISDALRPYRLAVHSSNDTVELWCGLEKVATWPNGKIPD